MARKQSKRARPRRRHSGASGAEGTVWLYGLHTVAAALRNPKREVRRLLITRPELRENLDRSENAIISDGVELSGLLPQGAVHQGIALETCPLPPTGLGDLLEKLEDGRIIVVLDQVTDPRNVGAIMRSSAAFGAAAVIQQERHGAAQTGVLAKAASGALESVPLVEVVNISRALDQLGAAGCWRLGLDADGSRSLTDRRPDGHVALVLGAEGAGLRRLTRERCDEMVRIPISGSVPSLNVSNAAAVALYALAGS